MSDTVRMVPLDEYAAMVGKSSRTIYRHIEAGIIPGAVNDGRGWYVPVDELVQPAPARTPLPPRETRGNVVDTAKRQNVSTVSAVLDSAPGFVSVSLAARLLGVSEYQVREHASELGGVYWGDNGSLVIPQKAIRGVFGISA